jgi:pimeloyl-ACP methyl ester carboxylesterase
MQMRRSFDPPPREAVEVSAHDGTHSADPRTPVGQPEWLDVDWRAHQRWVNVDGLPVNTVEIGMGEPVLFVHGLSGSWPNWLEQLPTFAARGYRAIAMDLPGFGHSPMPAERITIPLYARIVEGLMAELGLDAAVLVGNSMGGFVSLELAISFPERVERLALVSPAGLSSYRDPRGHRALRALHVLGPALERSLGWFAARAYDVTRHPDLRALALGDLVRHPRRIPAPLAAELVRGAGKPGFIDALEACITYNVRDRLPEIACPTLIVWGDRDRVITMRDAAVYAELIPNSRKVVYEDTGHLAMVERPAEFNALLGEFLAE